MLGRVQHACVPAVLSVLAGLALAQESQTDSAGQLLRQDQAERPAEEWRAAEATFRRVLQSDPENAGAYAGLGQSLYGRADFQNALAAFQRVLELAPTNSVMHFHLGCCHYRLGDFQHATDSLHTFLTANPTNAEGHYWLSRSLTAAGNHAEAEASIRKAIAVGTAPAHYYDQWGLCLAQQCRYLEAIAAHKQALSLDADDTFALLQLGTCYYESRAYREAVAPLEKYVKANPTNFYGFYYLGLSHCALRQFDQAARALQAAHELDPDHGFTRFELAMSYVGTRQYAKASGLYPFVFVAGGAFLTFSYAACLTCMLVISFKTRTKAVRSACASHTELGHAIPPLICDCQPVPPVIPGFVACEAAAAGRNRDPMLLNGDHANAWPGVWLALGWLVMLIAGNVPWTILLGLLPSFRGSAALLVGLGAASLPLIVVAATAFPRKPWGAPFRWPRPFPSAKLLGLSLLGLVGVGLFAAGYSGLVEWITGKPFPQQMTVPLIREALQSNPFTVGLSVVLLAPLAEEVLFRGLLFGALSRWLSPGWNIILTAAIFSLIHMQAIYFVPIFLVGLLCGWARHKSGSVALPMLLHVLNNGSSLVLMQLFPEAT